MMPCRIRVVAVCGQLVTKAIQTRTHAMRRTPILLAAVLLVVLAIHPDPEGVADT
jgi:hypothetical protein